MLENAAKVALVPLVSSYCITPKSHIMHVDTCSKDITASSNAFLLCIAPNIRDGLRFESMHCLICSRCKAQEVGLFELQIAS